MTWNPETHPYIARWSHPTGDRLTRFHDTIKHFATEIEAVDAIAAKFPAGVSSAHVVKYNQPGFIARRKRCKELRRG